jgi:hypothetical protein
MSTFGVGFNVTANTGQFVAGMRDAGEAAKGFKKTFNDTLGEGAFGGLARFLSVGGIAMALTSWFRNATDAAQQMRDEFAKTGQPLEDSVRSVAAFGDSIDSLKAGIKELSITTLSFFTRAGEGIGGIINWWRGLTDGGKALAEQAEKSGRAAEEQEKRLAELRKQYGPEAMAKADKELADIRRKNYMDSASAEEKYTALMDERFALAQRIENMAEGSVARKKAEAEQEKLTGEIEKARLAVTEQKRKEDEEIAKLADEYADTILEEGAAIDRNNTLLRESADLTARTAQEARLAADAREREAAATIRAVSAMAPFRGGDQLNDASDETLRGIISRNRAEAQRQRSDISKMTPFGNLGSMEAARLEQEAQNAQSVLDARNSLRRNVSIGGLDYARNQYRGDPLMFDQMVQRWVTDTRSQMEIAKDGNQLLKDLNDRLLKAGFGK